MVASWVMFGLILASGLGAQEAVVELYPYSVVSVAGMSDEPAIGLPTPVTQLRYAPGVDLQVRGYPELQADITVRGSTFEQTGVTLGALPLHDPQTGHYTAEVPLAPRMLGAPVLLTGAANAREGFNANVATIRYAWAPIREAGEVIAGIGSDSMRYGGLYRGLRFGTGPDGWAVDAGISHSQGDGTIGYGDFEVWRASARVQHRSRRSQTDLAFGYLDKFYGWPRMYTGAASAEAPLETEDYQTLLGALHHHQRYGGEGSYFTLAAGFRQLDDDYKYDRFRFPNLLFQHRTRVWTFSGQGEHIFDQHWALLYRGTLLRDELVSSTSLTNGDPSRGNDFSNRNYVATSAALRFDWETEERVRHRLEAGMRLAATDEDGSRLSPHLRWRRQQTLGAGALTVLADYAETGQVAGYTALRSEPSGLFGGNPNLGWERTRVAEVGAQWEQPGWELRVALFHREDDGLVDWTYSLASVNARQANAVAVDQWGAEIAIARSYAAGEARLAYGWIEKDARYEQGELDGAVGSFYVLNYPVQRVSGGLSHSLRDNLELAGEAEYRWAERNPLRTTGREALRVSLTLRWRPWADRGTQVQLLVDNLLDDDFEDLPGTPAVGRHASLRVLQSW